MLNYFRCQQLLVKPLFNIFKNHYRILTENRKISGQHVKLLPVSRTQGRTSYLIYAEITTFVPIQIFFILHMKNINSNNPKYTKMITNNTKISGQHVKLTSGANNLAAKLLFNIFRNHYFCSHIDILHAAHEKYLL